MTSYIFRSWIFIVSSTTEDYHWRELPQVSFLSRQNLCRDKTRLLSRQNYACHLFVAVTVLTRQKVSLSRQKFCRDKIMFIAPNSSDKRRVLLRDSNWNFFQVGYPVDTPTDKSLRTFPMIEDTRRTKTGSRMTAAAIPLGPLKINSPIISFDGTVTCYSVWFCGPLGCFNCVRVYS